MQASSISADLPIQVSKEIKRRETERNNRPELLRQRPVTTFRQTSHPTEAKLSRELAAFSRTGEISIKVWTAAMETTKFKDDNANDKKEKKATKRGEKWL